MEVKTQFSRICFLTTDDRRTLPRIVPAEEQLPGTREEAISGAADARHNLSSRSKTGPLSLREGGARVMKDPNLKTRPTALPANTGNVAPPEQAHRNSAKQN